MIAAMSVLTVEHLCKSYRTPEGERVPVVDIEGFTVAAGAQVALRGSSGSGKTTFLHMIAGILQPDGGRVLLAGTAVNGLPEAQRDRYRAQHLGYVFQSFNLLQGYTALENVLLSMMFAGEVDRARAEGLLERVGLADRMRYRPRQLSIGQQQRVAAARALANRPQLVLADEPTGNLDPVHGAAALDLMREVCQEQGAALLLVSHDAQVLASFDEVVEFAALNRAFPGGNA